MREFTDKPVCAKCGSENVTMKYKHYTLAGGTMICECSRCSHNWHMKTKDGK